MNYGHRSIRARRGGGKGGGGKSGGGKSGGSNPNYPAKTGNLSGKGRGNVKK